MTITPRLDTHGAVNLILTDGSHLTAQWGINVKEGDTFTVYAQSTGEDTMGRLTACLSQDFNSDGSVKYYVWPSRELSGIGAVSAGGGTRWFYENEGTIIINGGYILAKGRKAPPPLAGRTAVLSSRLRTSCGRAARLSSTAASSVPKP